MEVDQIARAVEVKMQPMRISVIEDIFYLVLDLTVGQDYRKIHQQRAVCGDWIILQPLSVVFVNCNDVVKDVFVILDAKLGWQVQ